MITVMIHAKVKQEMLADYLELIQQLTEKTSKKGCLNYSFNQNREEKTEFVLYEQWESQAHLDQHIQELFEILGPPKPGDPIPEILMNMYEKATPVFYDVIG